MYLRVYLKPFPQIRYIWCKLKIPFNMHDAFSRETTNPSKTSKPTAWWRYQMKKISALLALCAGNSPVTGEFLEQWRGDLMFPLICAWINVWVNNRDAVNLRRHRAHYDVIVMGRRPPDLSRTYKMGPDNILAVVSVWLLLMVKRIIGVMTSANIVVT